MIRIDVETITYKGPHWDGHDADYLPDGESVAKTYVASFKDLVALLINESILLTYDWPPPDPPGMEDFLECDAYVDFRSGEWTVLRVWYSRSNPARNLKYWRKAWRAVGIIK